VSEWGKKKTNGARGRAIKAVAERTKTAERKRNIGRRARTGNGAEQRRHRREYLIIAVGMKLNAFR